MIKPLSLLFLLILLFSCSEDEGRKTLNSRGEVKLDVVPEAGWAIAHLVVSQDGLRIYYSLTSFNVSKYEIRMIDEQGLISKLYWGDGTIESLAISDDGKRLLYSVYSSIGLECALYEFNLASKDRDQLLSVSADGRFWDLHYLDEDNIVYTQGDGAVQLSLRRFNRSSKAVTVLMEKTENPILFAVDKTHERLLIRGWSNGKIMTLKADGTELKEYGDPARQNQPVSFSSDGTEILVGEVRNSGAITEESYWQTIVYNVETGERTALTNLMQNSLPVAYGENQNAILISAGNEFAQRELVMYNRVDGEYRQLTDNSFQEFFLGYYGNSTRRLLYKAMDNNKPDALYILNW